MAPRNLHVVHFLIRQNLAGNQVGFLLYLHEHWSDAGDAPYLALPAKKTVTDPLAEFIQGTPLDVYIDAIARDDWKLPSDAYDVDQEIRGGQVHDAFADPQGRTQPAANRLHDLSDRPLGRSGAAGATGQAARGPMAHLRARRWPSPGFPQPPAESSRSSRNATRISRRNHPTQTRRSGTYYKPKPSAVSSARSPTAPAWTPWPRNGSATTCTAYGT